jgi:nitrogen fixation protein FixH
MSEIALDEPGRPRSALTGRMVLVLLFAFFATVASVNAVMIHYALSTFRGQVADHPYEVGLAFNREIAASHAQDARHWAVEIVLPRSSSDRRFEASIRDASGAPIDGLKVVATFAAPVDGRLDRSVELTERASGRYAGEIPVAAGNWDLEIRSDRDGEPLFRSKNRVVIE